MLVYSEIHVSSTMLVGDHNCNTVVVIPTELLGRR